MLRKEDVYIRLEGMSKDELTELYWVLKNNNEPIFRNEIEDFLLYTEDIVVFLDFDNTDWGSSDLSVERTKTEVTIQQLKEILQPMETLQQKEQRLLKELEEVRKEIEDSKIKVGDWVVSEKGIVMKVKSVPLIMTWKKITNPQLIELLENEIK